MTDHPSEATDFECTIKKRRLKPEAENSELIEVKKARKLEKGRYVKHCMELIVFNLYPISLLNAPAFRNLTKIHADASNFVMNSSNAMLYLSAAAESVRMKISVEVDGILISIKLDEASRYDRSILGVNAQFFSKTKQKIIIRCLGMIELKKSHTSRYLEDQVCLEFIHLDDY